MHVLRNPQCIFVNLGWGWERVVWGDNNHVNLNTHGLYGVQFGWGKGGVGWGNHVHVSHTHMSCYALPSSLALAHTHTHVMPPSGIFSCNCTILRTHVMLRSAIFSCTCTHTHTSCYALGSSLALTHTHTSCYALGSCRALAHTHTWDHGIFSCTRTRTHSHTHPSCYALRSSLVKWMSWTSTFQTRANPNHGKLEMTNGTKN